MKINLEKVIQEGLSKAFEDCEADMGMTMKEAVGKQIAKKPIECTDLYPPKQYECPNCGYCVGRHKYMKPTHFGDVLADCKVEFRYCPDCGQKLDWSEK